MHHHGNHHHQCHPGAHFAGRRGPGRGFTGGEQSPFGRGFGRGGGPFRGGKMLGDGDLKLIVLALLAEEPRHGYDIIKALEERSRGFYSPSPGTVYPTLTFVEEAGYASAASEGNKKVYAITEAGRAHLDGNREATDSILHAMERYGEKMARARAWYDKQDDGGAEMPGVLREVNQARKELKQAMAAKLDASEEEQQRMARILREAAEAIRGGPADED